MNTRTAAPLIIISSLAVLLTGCGGGAGPGGRDGAAVGLARGHVIVMDDLSPARDQRTSLAQQADTARPLSADERRELKGNAPRVAVQPFSAEVWRELKGNAPSAVAEPFSAEVRRELKGNAPSAVAEPFSAEVWRELKGGAAPGTTSPLSTDLSATGGG